VIVGTVNERRVPVVSLTIGENAYRAIIDTGFNGDLELPETLRPELQPRFVGESVSFLASGVTVIEDLYLVEFPFDGTVIEAETSFVDGDEILVGTKLLGHHRLEIDFVHRTVLIDRVLPSTVP
jgi:predicted aspartyl protease